MAMERLYRIVLVLLAMSMHTLWASAQRYVVFAHDNNWLATPVEAIDSITFSQPPMLDVFFGNRKVMVLADSAFLIQDVPDTLSICYQDESVTIYNPRLGHIQTDVNGANVAITATGHQPFVCKATGKSSNGRLVIDSDTTFTLVLAGLTLASQKASALSIPQKQKATIVLADGTFNTLSDAVTYQADSTDTSNGCLYTKGSLTITGGGTLGVTGNNRHAISSGKNITVEDGHLIIYNTVKDGLHCDKFQINGGTIDLHLATDASKGIKCKDDFTMTGGRIIGEATGNVVIEDGETSYCSLLKSGGAFKMDGGEITLKHKGGGGRCISVDGNMRMKGGTMSLECHGDGGSYLTSANDSDYYTPKCITADDSLSIIGGTISCVSTGLGGKGIVGGKYLAIGDKEGYGPTIKVETQGECIVNNVDEDLRSGCPKGIKANEKLCIYGGDIAVTTEGMGGEGVESNGTMFVYGGTLECNTFDDGINVADSIEIAGGQVYCCSVDNDGIDSNGSITISGGIVASVNKKRPNESFDAVKGRFRIMGGIVFGIGSSAVEVKESVVPFYSTPYDDDVTRSGGLILTEGKYIYIMSGNEVMMALKNDNRSLRAFLTISHPALIESGYYLISEGDWPIGIRQTFFNDKLNFNGQPNNSRPITSIQVQTKH